jgi:hypothetical protein
MWLTSWLRNRNRSRDAVRKPASIRPQLEVLEGRDVPSTLSVTSNLGFGPGTLRTEIALAQSGDTIVFDKSVTGTISLGSGGPAGGIFELYISKNLDIEGPGAGRLAISGYSSRVFEVAAGAQVTLSGLTIEGGDGRNGSFDPQVNDGLGGGILNWGTLTLNGCTVTNNFNQIGSPWMDLGGGIYNEGTLTLSGTTVTHNYAAGDGAGIYNASTGTLTVLNSSVTRNCEIINGSVLGECDLHNLGQYTVDSHSKIGVIC